MREEILGRVAEVEVGQMIRGLNVVAKRVQTLGPRALRFVNVTRDCPNQISQAES